MSEYTKGPWFNKGYEIHAEGCCIEIAKVTVFNQGKANANLIAAAPDMLEALESMVNLMDCGDEYGEGGWWHKMASAAIAKAKGGE